MLLLAQDGVLPFVEYSSFKMIGSDIARVNTLKKGSLFVIQYSFNNLPEEMIIFSRPSYANKAQFKATLTLILAKTNEFLANLGESKIPMFI